MKLIVKQKSINIIEESIMLQQKSQTRQLKLVTQLQKLNNWLKMLTIRPFNQIFLMNKKHNLQNKELMMLMISKNSNMKQKMLLKLSKLLSQNYHPFNLNKKLFKY